MKLIINEEYKDVMLEALGDFLYKISLELNHMKGQSMTKRRKELTKKQRIVEEVRRGLNGSD